MNYKMFREWNEPLIIRSQQKLFLITLNVDRVNQVIHTEINEERPRGSPVKFTEIELHLPISKGYVDLVRLQNFLVDHTTFNTHIGFIFKLDDTDRALSFPQVQSINTQRTNVASIYYYTLSEFENLILGLQNNEIPVYDVIREIFRERSNMKKEKGRTNDNRSIKTISSP